MRHLSLISLLFFSMICFAQPDKQSNNWYFGDFTGLDFSNGSPIPKTDGNVIALFRGTSVASDENGNLLLYSDGEHIWNRLHEVIKGSENLGGGSLLINHNGLIAPHPKNARQFYVFYIPDADYSGKAEIKYALVDLSLNGGKGEVVNSNISLTKDQTRTFALIRHCNNKDFWLITHETNSNNFRAYLIDDNGINSSSPIISSIGSIHNGTMSQTGQLRRYTSLKPSFDGSKIAVSITKEEASAGSFLEVFDFNNKSGKVIKLAHRQSWLKYPSGAVNDMSFSADNKKVYVTRTFYKKIDSENEEYQSDLFQVDLNKKADEETSITLLTSRKFLLDALKNDGPHVKGIGGLQMGPNGKIYVAYNLKTSIGVISTPNADGLNCGFTELGVDLSPKSSGWTLPNLVPKKNQPAASTISYRLSQDGCNGTILSSLRGLDKTKNITYQWYKDGKLIVNASDSTYKVVQSGLYYLVATEQNGCQSAISGSIQINAKEILPPQKQTYDFACEGDKIQPITVVGTNIKWYADKQLNKLLNTGNQHIPNINTQGQTSYKVFVTQTNSSNCESFADSVEIKISPKPKIEVSDSQFPLCLRNNSGNSISLKTNDQVSVEWVLNNQVVGKEKTLKPTSYGQYIVVATNQNKCSTKDTVDVVESCYGIYLPQAFSPNDDGINDILRVYGSNIISFDLHITNRSSTYVFSSKGLQFDGEFVETWDGKLNGETVVSGNYHYYLEAKIIEADKEKTIKREGNIVVIR